MNKNAARSLFLQESFGILSTISLDVPGYPFGSVTPYCADEQCRPIIYISTIAQHTRNLKADPKVSLTIVESGSADVQAAGRVTCLADAKPLDQKETRARERYFRYFPTARQYDQTHDFGFYRFELVRIRFIGGFGQIFWIEPDAFMTANPFSASQESMIVDHMNKDHAAALQKYAGGESAVMTGIDAEGFDILTSTRKHRIDFDRPIRTMDEAREALVAMAKKSA